MQEHFLYRDPQSRYRRSSLDLYRIQNRCIRHKFCKSVDTKRFIHPGNEEQQANARILHKILKRIHLIITRKIRQHKRALVHQLDEAGRPRREAMHPLVHLHWR